MAHLIIESKEVELGITVTYVDGPSDARVILGSVFDCVQSYVRPV